MYSNIPGVQILVSLLKQYNIKHIVASPGSRNAALVHTLENDDFFKLYSIVDERSAAYFALGLSEELGVPVCVSCTSATATCNYMPAIQEAFERNIQLIALTADRNAKVKFHMDDQNINQVNMYDGYVKYAVDLPNVKSSEDAWYFNRGVNEALLHLDYNGKGPVQINFEMNYGLEELSYFPCKELPKTRKIEKYSNDINWQKICKEINDKKVLVLCGSNYYKDNALKEALLQLKSKTNAVIMGDYYSNLLDDDIINASVLGNVYKGIQLNELKPDLIILLGNVVYLPLKYNKELFGSGVETWQISKQLQLNDGFRNVRKIFELSEEEFFTNINNNIKENMINTYDITWKKVMNMVKFPELQFTHMNVIKKFIESIPDKVLVHTSVLDAIRITNYYKLPSQVKCFGNIGADGIDGALSTFLGQASTSESLSFLIIGDLSFLYDMNALYMDIPKNIRILVINNYAGSEFYRNFGTERIPTLRDFIAAGHNSSMKDVSSISKMQYICATNDDELKDALKRFVEINDSPILLEVITDADRDAKKLTEFWNLNIPNFQSKEAKLKAYIKQIIKPTHINKLKKFLKK